MTNSAKWLANSAFGAPRSTANGSASNADPPSGPTQLASAGRGAAAVLHVQRVGKHLPKEGPTLFPAVLLQDHLVRSHDRAALARIRQRELSAPFPLRKRFPSARQRQI